MRTLRSQTTVALCFVDKSCNAASALDARSCALLAGRDGQVPGFVLDEVDGLTVLRYMMAEGAPNKAAPKGKGDGAYTPLEGPETVVAIVGSAHVRGMCRQWQNAQQNLSVSELLKS
jgi:hypothetical protein